MGDLTRRTHPVLAAVYALMLCSCDAQPSDDAEYAETVEIPATEDVADAMNSSYDASAAAPSTLTDLPDLPIEHIDTQALQFAEPPVQLEPSGSGLTGHLYPRVSIHDEPSETRYFDERAARRRAERKVGVWGYDRSFGCTQDCSGHEAGWAWRAENPYPTYGSLEYGRSSSFAEGAQAYENAVDEELKRERRNFEFGDDTFATDRPY